MEHKFQINLRGIIDLLSHHLYSGPEVFVRELNLPAEFAEQLDESVRESFLARWRSVQMTPPQE